jgi:hypothetical protein
MSQKDSKIYLEPSSSSGSSSIIKEMKITNYQHKLQCLYCFVRPEILGRYSLTSDQLLYYHLSVLPPLFAIA